MVASALEVKHFHYNIIWYNGVFTLPDFDSYTDSYSDSYEIYKGYMDQFS